MGIALWLGCALVVFIIARRIRYARPARWFGELFAAILSALVMGVIATALDFGGWNELDWRAGVFCFLGSAAVVGGVRLFGLRRIKGKCSPTHT
jgi:uncharacterized membrane protein YeaQ/YmgE (transglycosylase-associated protein family)